MIINLTFSLSTFKNNIYCWKIQKKKSQRFSKMDKNKCPK